MSNFLKGMSVFIVGAHAGYAAPFLRMGAEVTVKEDKADILVFCGGTDVHPDLYGVEPKFHEANYDLNRDRMEEAMFNKYPDKWKIGICRGNQFLGVMNGYKLNQHIDDHIGKHDVRYKGEVFNITSTHHQSLMILTNTQRGFVKVFSDGKPEVPECFVIRGSKSIGVQWHPEFDTPTSDSQELFEIILEEYM